MIKKKIAIILLLLYLITSVLPYYTNIFVRSAIFDIALMTPSCDTLWVDSDLKKIITILPNVNSHPAIMDLHNLSNEQRDSIKWSAFSKSYGIDSDFDKAILFLKNPKDEVLITRVTNFCIFQTVDFSFAHNWHRIVFINFLGRPVKLFQSQLTLRYIPFLPENFAFIEWFQSRDCSSESPYLDSFEYLSAEKILELIKSDPEIRNEHLELSLRCRPVKKGKTIDELLEIMENEFIEKIIIDGEKIQVFPINRQLSNYKFYTCFTNSTPIEIADSLGYTIFEVNHPSKTLYRHIDKKWYLSQGVIALSHVYRL